MATDFQVKNPSGRTLFRCGLEKDARQWVEQNFPHVHVEPGMDYGDGGPAPDVVLTDPDGNQWSYLGGEWRETEYEEGSNNRFRSPSK